MLKFGIISSIDFSAGLARVYFEEDDIVSAPLKISVMRAGPDQVTFPFGLNEHVWCLMDEHSEYGVIGGAIFDEENNPSGMAAGKLLIKFADSSFIQYDRNSHILDVNINGKINVNCTEADVTCTGASNVDAQQVNITAAETNITGIVNITGALNVSGVASVGGLASITPGTPVDAGSADLNVNSVNASDDIKAGTVSLKGHKHTSSPGGGITSTPIP